MKYVDLLLIVNLRLHIVGLEQKKIIVYQSTNKTFSCEGACIKWFMCVPK